MGQEKFCGLFIGLFGASTLFGTSEAIATGLQMALPFAQIFTLTLCLQLLVALSACLSGAAALTELKGGVSAAFVAMLSMFALTVFPVFFGASRVVEIGPLLSLFILVSLFLGLLMASWRTDAPATSLPKPDQSPALGHA